MPFKQQPDRGCSVSECPYKHEAKGYCKTHYMRSLKGQNPHDYPATDRAAIRLCETPNCGQKHYAHGLCKAEYERSKQQNHLGNAPPKDRLANAPVARLPVEKNPTMIMEPRLSPRVPLVVNEVPPQTSDCPPHHWICGTMEDGITLQTCRKCGSDGRTVAPWVATSEDNRAPLQKAL